MDLSYSKAYKDFQTQVRAFLKSNWPLSGGEAQLSKAEQGELFRARAVEHGYSLRHIPKKYGGSEQEADALKAEIIRAEFDAARVPHIDPRIGMMNEVVVPTILAKGADWMKEKFVPKIVTGEYIFCQCYSEPGAGSDLASLKTKGELVGDEWILNGQKIWTSRAHFSHYCVALVRTESDATKYRGITYMIIDMNQPGVEVRPLKQITGVAEFNEVFFTDARTPKDWIVGERGEGWAVSRMIVDREHSTFGGAARSQKLFERLLGLARKSSIDGNPAIENVDIRRRLARLEGRIRSLQYTGYRMLTKQGKGEKQLSVSKMVKLYSTQIAHEVAAIAQDIIDDNGMMMPRQDVERSEIGDEKWVFQYLGSIAHGIGGGTSNVHRNIIAEKVLGLPKDAARAS
jgi:alkylation response protein AidB-like acyl-CoA dehydrogenase